MLKLFTAIDKAIARNKRKRAKAWRKKGVNR